MTNLSTLLIYGALYVFSYFNSLFLQGTIGYTAIARRACRAFPAACSWSSSRPASAPWRRGTGRASFMAVGPAIMGLGLLWLARFPADQRAWLLEPVEARHAPALVAAT